MKWNSINGRFESLILDALKLGPATSREIEIRVILEGWKITPDVHQIGRLCNHSPKIEKYDECHNGMTWILKEA